jgi:hypothetical protein
MISDPLLGLVPARAGVLAAMAVLILATLILATLILATLILATLILASLILATTAPAASASAICERTITLRHTRAVWHAGAAVGEPGWRIAALPARLTT